MAPVVLTLEEMESRAVKDMKTRVEEKNHAKELKKITKYRQLWQTEGDFPKDGPITKKHRLAVHQKAHTLTEEADKAAEGKGRLNSVQKAATKARKRWVETQRILSYWRAADPYSHPAIPQMVLTTPDTPDSEKDCPNTETKAPEPEKAPIPDIPVTAPTPHPSAPDSSLYPTPDSYQMTEWAREQGLMPPPYTQAPQAHMTQMLLPTPPTVQAPVFKINGMWIDATERPVGYQNGAP